MTSTHIPHRSFATSPSKLIVNVTYQISSSQLFSFQLCLDDALMDACATGQLELAEWCLSNGAQVNARNSHGATSLMLASRNGYGRVVELLCSHHAETKRHNDRNMTSLAYATRCGFSQVVTALLENGADVNETGPGGLRPLDYAVVAGNSCLVEILMECGASIQKNTETGKTPKDLAKYFNHSNVVPSLKKTSPKTMRGLKKIDISSPLKDSFEDILGNYEKTIDTHKDVHYYKKTHFGDTTATKNGDERYKSVKDISTPDPHARQMADDTSEGSAGYFIPFGLGNLRNGTNSYDKVNDSSEYYNVSNGTDYTNPPIQTTASNGDSVAHDGQQVHNDCLKPMTSNSQQAQADDTDGQVDERIATLREADSTEKSKNKDAVDPQIKMAKGVAKPTSDLAAQAAAVGRDIRERRTAHALVCEENETKLQCSSESKITGLPSETKTTGRDDRLPVSSKGKTFPPAVAPKPRPYPVNNAAPPSGLSEEPTAPSLTPTVADEDITRRKPVGRTGKNKQGKKKPDQNHLNIMTLNVICPPGSRPEFIISKAHNVAVGEMEVYQNVNYQTTDESSGYSPTTSTSSNPESSGSD